MRLHTGKLCLQIKSDRDERQAGTDNRACSCYWLQYYLFRNIFQWRSQAVRVSRLFTKQLPTTFKRFTTCSNFPQSMNFWRALKYSAGKFSTTLVQVRPLVKHCWGWGNEDGQVKNTILGIFWQNYPALGIFYVTRTLGHSLWPSHCWQIHFRTSKYLYKKIPIKSFQPVLILILLIHCFSPLKNLKIFFPVLT